MKLTTILMFIAFMQVDAAAIAQRLTYKANNITYEKLFKEIKKQTGYHFAYRPETFDGLSSINIDVTNGSLSDILDRCFKDKPLEYIIVDKTIVVKRKEVSSEVKAPADNIAIIGTVRDEQNKPMAGVTIKLKGTDKRWATNDRGLFECILTDKDPVLVFSFIGYETQELPIKSPKLPIVITMKASNNELDAVQVTTYSKSSKRLSAGNITTITGEELAKNPVLNVMNALQGRVPGLFIQQNTGAVGGSYTIKIRSSTNFTPSTIGSTQNAPQPLILLNGAPIPAGTLPEITRSGEGDLAFQGGSALNYLNPSDIESIEILKDADATAIYGSRGAYGVILITTKKGKKGPNSLTANIYEGYSVAGTTPKLMNLQQYLEIRREALKNDGLTADDRDLDLNGTWSLTKGTDWQKYFEGTHAPNTNAALAYSGGNDQTSFLVSGSLRNQQHQQVGTGSYTDGDIRADLNTHSLNNKFQLSLDATYSASLNDMVALNLGGINGPANAPNYPALYLPDGSLDWSLGVNPAAYLNSIYRNNVNTLNASTTLSYTPFKGLTLKADLSYQRNASDELIAFPSSVYIPDDLQEKNTNTQFNHYDINSIRIAPFAEYDTKLGQKGDLTITAGGELNNSSTLTNNIGGTDFSSDALITDPAAANNVTANYGSLIKRSLSAFSVIKYVWDDRYILSLNGRRDGSNAFGPGRRFGNFGSIAGAWVFSNEKWFSNALPFISFGKLRASTGLIGGDALPPYQYLSVYTVNQGTYNGKNGYNPSTVGNPNLNWEKDKRSEIGLEFALFKNRIFFDGDYYSNVATNQVLPFPVTTITGFQAQYLNSDAVIHNYGWEFNIKSTNIKGNSLSWTSNFNLTIPKSILEKLPSESLGVNGGNEILGRSTSGVLLYKYDGVDPQTGEYTFENKAGVKGTHLFDLSQADKTQWLDLAPKFYGGFQNTVSYHRFTLDFLFSYTKQMGRTFLGQQQTSPGYYNVNMPVEDLKRWQKPGDITNVPKASTNGLRDIFGQGNFGNSTGAYGDASYIRLQNLSLNYQFAPTLARKLGVADLNIFFQGQNLWTISRYGGLDPQNLSIFSLPQMRTLTAGLNVKF